VWIQFAEFELRQQELDAARKILGTAIGMAPKEKVRLQLLSLVEQKLTNLIRIWISTVVQGVHRYRIETA
jgi:crooked neck